jgi:hypothetical protein
MDNIESVTNTFSGVWGQITGAPAHLLLALLLNVIGYMLKRTPIVKNDWIPWIIILLGTALYPLLVSPTLEQYQKYSHPWLILMIYGFLLGTMALVLHRILLKRFGVLLNGLFADDPEQPKTP